MSAPHLSLFAQLQPGAHGVAAVENLAANTNAGRSYAQCVPSVDGAGGRSEFFGEAGLAEVAGENCFRRGGVHAVLCSLVGFLWASLRLPPEEMASGRQS